MMIILKNYAILLKSYYLLKIIIRIKIHMVITEDEEHKNNFIKIGNKGAKINRHNDILPYTFNVQCL